MPARYLCRELERSGLDSISWRAVVSTSRKLKVLARLLALLETEWTPAGKLAAMHQLDETRFLIEAVTAAPPRDAARLAKVRARLIEDRVVWVIDLFARLEQRDRLQRTASFR